ncbi:hypothetical protein [Vibrio sp. 10N.222.52.B7]|uniref:hypothetical protein n=1 Tax=Vibrio sp. 10N.222.52.B7 TaxID=3229629 RepID=UPI00354F4E89
MKKDLKEAKVFMFLNLAENHYAPLNKSNCAAVTIETDTKFKIYLNHATKSVNQRGQAIPFNKYLTSQGITRDSHNGFYKQISRKLPTIQDCYYGHTEFDTHHIFVIVDICPNGEHTPELFVVQLFKNNKTRIYTPKRAVSFNSKDQFASKLILATTYDRKTRDDRIIEAAENKTKIIMNEKLMPERAKHLETEIENGELKMTIENLQAELKQRDEKESATIKDLKNTVSVFETEINALKAELAKLKA